MRIKLQNRYIIPLVPFLQNIKLKGEKSRARSKFLALATAAYNALHQSEVELLKEYAVLDEAGNPAENGDGSFNLKEETKKEYFTERQKLFEEEAEIEGGTYTAHLALMRQILAEYDEVLDGEEAALYDALWDAFAETDKTEKGEESHAG